MIVISHLHLVNRSSGTGIRKLTSSWVQLQIQLVKIQPQYSIWFCVQESFAVAHTWHPLPARQPDRHLTSRSCVRCGAPCTFRYVWIIRTLSLYSLIFSNLHKSYSLDCSSMSKSAVNGSGISTHISWLIGRPAVFRAARWIKVYQNSSPVTRKSCVFEEGRRIAIFILNPLLVPSQIDTKLCLDVSDSFWYLACLKDLMREYEYRKLNFP